jgi:hypothetical protein
MTAPDIAKNTFMDALADMTRGLYQDEEWKLYRNCHVISPLIRVCRSPGLCP